MLPAAVSPHRNSKRSSCLADTGGGVRFSLVLSCRVPGVVTIQLLVADWAQFKETPVSVTARTKVGCGR